MRRLPRLKRRRASASLEGAMALPVFLVLFGAVSQVMITAQSRMHLEHAAYAAARAALVHMCPPFNLVEKLKSGSIPDLRPTDCELNESARNSVAQRKAEDAARWALIAAAPTTGHAAGRGCDRVPAAEEILTGGDHIQGRSQAAINALCYVHEPGNVTVTVGWDQNLMSQLLGETDVPMRATVTFRFPLSTPFRRFIYDAKRGDGTYWKEGTATVTLL
ncbi:MAG: hypothetical protein AAF871_02525 [Pseudomonadota bacterium]